MFTDIFSCFDNSVTLFSINILFIGFFLLNSWSFINLQILNQLFFSLTSKQIIRVGARHFNGAKLLLTSLFIYLIYINSAGLWPIVPSLSSHIWFSFSLGGTIWFLILLSSIKSSPKAVVAHLYPEGAPFLLGPFLILIETVSILIRPLTLSVRLVANLRAGHIVIGLIRNYIIRVSSLYLLQVGYFIFEFAIAVIQAYIFFLLLSLYSND